MMKNIKPLPISEEKLGAYIEGNSPQNEMEYIESVIQNNSSLADFVNEISVEDIDLDVSIYDEIPNFDNEFVLPEIPIDLDNTIDLEINPFEMLPSFPMVAYAAYEPEDGEGVDGGEAFTPLENDNENADDEQDSSTDNESLFNNEEY